MKHAVATVPHYRDSFARLADRLVTGHGVVPVFSGTPAETGLVKDVIARMEQADAAIDRLPVEGDVAVDLYRVVAFASYGPKAVCFDS